MKRALILTAIAATLLAIPVTHVLAQSGNSKECCVSGRHTLEGRIISVPAGACAAMFNAEVGCGLFGVIGPGQCEVFCTY